VGLPQSISALDFSPGVSCPFASSYTVTAIPSSANIGADDYEWTVTGGHIVTAGGNVASTVTTATSITFEPTNTGNFSISVTPRNTCGSGTPFSKAQNCFAGGGGTAKSATTTRPAAAAVICTPNPAKNVVAINTASMRVADPKASVYLRVLDLNGRVLIERATNSLVEEISLQKLSAGLYMVQLSNEEETVMEKLIVQ
jgi:hypothetical protein